LDYNLLLELEDMLSTLKAKKRKLEATDQQVELEVLLDFLRNTRAEKEEASERVQSCFMIYYKLNALIT